MIELTIESKNANTNEIVVNNTYICDSIETALAKIHNMCNAKNVLRPILYNVNKDDNKIGEITFRAYTCNSDGSTEYVTYFYINAAKVLTINDVYNNDI